MTKQDRTDQDTDQPHVYHRSFQANERNSITVICAKVQANSLVLDLGAGSGVIGQYLSTKNCIVDGIDLNLKQTDHAAHYRSLQSADLETQALSELITEQYDVIICADILEHLRNPRQLLDQLNRFLKSDGRVILSVPNVAHISLVSDLVEGAFEYRSEGLLDNTHVRFFTRRSLKNLLHQSGLGIIAIEQIELDPRETEFEQYPDRFPPKLFNLLVSRADALTYQFIVEATWNDIVKETLDETAQPSTDPQVTLSYAVQLFWRAQHQDYDYQRSVTAIGRIGEEQQQLLLEIPAMTQTCGALRLDVADRCGYVRIDDIKLCNPAGIVIWEWSGDADELFSLGHRQDIEIAKLDQGQSGAVILAGSDESFFELPIHGHLLKEITNGGSLQLTQSFPMSADYLVLAPRLSALAQRQVEQIDELKQMIASRDCELAIHDATIQSHQASPEQREQIITAKQRQIEELKHLCELQSRQIEEREQLIDERDRWLTEKQDRAERQYNKVAELETLMKQHHLEITQKTNEFESREQSIQQQLQTRDESIQTLTTELETLQQQIEEYKSIQFWLQRPFKFLRNRMLDK